MGMKRHGRSAFAVGLMLSACAFAGDVPPVYRATTEQRALAATLRTPPMPAGRNVYPVLAGFADAPKLTPDETKVLCSRSTPSCLALVRQNLTAVRQVMARRASMVARVERVASYDIWWNTSEPDPDHLYVPPLSPVLLLWPTLAALRFADGDPAGGLATACTAAATLRRMHVSSNTLIDSMVTLGGASRAMHLSAELLAERPASVPVPQSCRIAFAAPEARDVDFRGAMAYEWRFIGRGLANEGLDGTEYAIVAPFALLASDRAAAAMLDDETFPDTAFEVASPSPGEVAHLPELATARKASEEMARKYMARSADYVATIRIAGLALWLDDHPSGESLPRRLAAAPVGVLAKRIQPACDGLCLAMTDRDTLTPGQTWPVKAAR
jgi:hypothetical protein